jgi:hypothetical protein
MLTEIDHEDLDSHHTRIPVTLAAHAPALPAAEIAAATEYARAEKATATRRAYRSDFEIYRAWCAERRASAARHA